MAICIYVGWVLSYGKERRGEIHDRRRKRESDDDARNGCGADDYFGLGFIYVPLNLQMI